MAYSAKLPDWRERLAAFIEARRDAAFVWGSTDCCLTAADAARAMTGSDLAAPLRGYRSRFGACRALVRQGCRDVAAYLDSILPRAEFPQEGDFVLAPDPPLDAVLIYAGRGRAWHQGADGLQRIAVPDNFLAWRL